jgi:hypothetical protein
MATFGTFIDGATLKATELNDLFKSTQFLPVVSQPASITSTVRFGKYQQVNKLVFYQMSLRLTNPGTSNTRIEVSLPVTAATNSERVIGFGFIEDDSANDVLRVAVVRVSTTKVAFLAEGSTSLTTYVGQTGGPTLTLESGDDISLNIVYEAA